MKINLSSAVKVKNVAAMSRNCYKRLNHVRLLNTRKERSDSSHSKRRKSAPATKRGEEVGVDSQISVMMGHLDGERSLGVSFAEIEESVVELFVRRELT